MAEKQISAFGAFGNSELLGFLERLVPAGTIVLVDVHSREYPLPRVVPARRQIRAMQQLGRLLQAPALQTLSSSFGVTAAAQRPDAAMGALMGGLTMVFGDETAMGLLATVLVEAYGDALRVGGAPAPTAEEVMDLFPLEEMLRAVLPLLVRLLQQTLRVVGNDATVAQA